MTDLLEEAIHRLRQLPEFMQDCAARAVLLQLEEEQESGDHEFIMDGRLEYLRDKFVTLEQYRPEIASE